MATGLENPLTEDRGIFDNTAESLRNRWVGKDMEALQAAIDEGNYPRAGLRGLGAIGGTIGDIVAMPFDAAFEVLGINDKIGEYIKKGLDTETGKKVVQLIAENPEYAGDIKATLDTLSAIPAFKVSKTILNDLFHNLETKVEGGTPGALIQAAREKVAALQGKDAPDKPNFYNSAPLRIPLVAGGLVDSAFYTLNDRLNPFQRATTRASGFPAGKRSEMANLINKGESSDAMGALATARMQQEQRYGAAPAMFGKDTPLHKYMYLDTGVPATDTQRIAQLIGGKDIPDEVVQRHLVDFQKAVLAPTRMQRLNPASQGTTVDVPNPNARRGSSEYAAQPMDQAPGSAVNKMFREDRLADLPPDTTMNDLARAAKAADDLNSPRGLVPLVKDAVKGKKRPDLGGKVEATKYMLKALDKSRKGKKLTDKEQQALDFFNETDVRPTEAGMQHVGTSHISQLKEYGGIHDMYSMQSGDTLFGSMSDKHDLFGANFLRPAQEKAAIFPIQKRTLGEDKAVTAARKERFLTKEDVNQIIPTASLEKVSGVPKKPKETAVDYHLRAIAEMRKNPETRDYAEALMNLGIVGTLGASNRQEK